MIIIGKITVWPLTSVVAILLLLVGYRKYRQRKVMNKSKNLINNGGISELREVELGNSKQYVLIEGKDLTKPICLFLHGGPGVPIPFGANSRSLYPEITNAGVGVFWDQRGAGKSYRSNRNVANMNIRQMIQDANELVDYLRTEFSKEKIYLVGLSWGSILATELVRRYPEKFHAYIAGAQVVNPEESDRIAYNWLIKQVGKSGNNKSLNKLKSIGQPPFRNKKDSNTFGNILMKDSEAFNKKTENEKGVNFYRLMEGVLYSPDYTLKNVWETMVNSMDFNMNKSPLPNEIQKVDLMSSVQQLHVPVYIMHGKYDMRAPLELTVKYFEKLAAPSKELILLERSAHNPSEGDLEKLISYIGDILSN